MAATDPAVRSISARIAALSRWSKVDDPTAATAPARLGLRAKFAREIDPAGQLTAVELETRVDRAHRAHMARMTLASRTKRRAA